MEKRKIPQNIRAKGITPLPESNLVEVVEEPVVEEVVELEAEAEIVAEPEPEPEIIKKPGVYKRIRSILGGNK